MVARRRGAKPDAQMTVVEHLAELRRRLMISVVALLVGGVIAYVFSLDIIAFLIRYYERATDGRHDALIFLGPADAFVTRLKIATYGAVVLAMPVWLYQLWRFVTPGLNPNERRYALPFVLSAIALFITGAVFALFMIQPALDFLLGVAGSDLEPTLSADRYLSMVSLMILAFGLAFEFPVVLVFLLLAGVLSTGQLSRWRRPVILAVVVFSAFITPADPYSLVFMAVPMYLFYEVSIIIGKLIKR